MPTLLAALSFKADIKHSSLSCWFLCTWGVNTSTALSTKRERNNQSPGERVPAWTFMWPQQSGRTCLCGHFASSSRVNVVNVQLRVQLFRDRQTAWGLGKLRHRNPVVKDGGPEQGPGFWRVLKHTETKDTGKWTENYTDGRKIKISNKHWH